MRITVDVDMAGSAIRKIQSPSKEHAISISLGNLSTESGRSTPQMSKASITLTHETAELSTDFVLQILVDNLTSPRAVVECLPTFPNHQALMTTFVPKFKLELITPEIVFIADQSGSMGGQKNSSLVAAMTTFLKSLPLGVRFNICPFGSLHEFLWDKSKPYTSETASEALAYVQGFHASFGGTEMFPAVEATFKRRLGDMPLEIFPLTDGQIYQEKALFDLVHGQLHNEKVDARVFTLGIGNYVSTTLVEGLARAGQGFSQFVKESEVLNQKVVRMLKAALYPHIHDFRLEPNYADDMNDFEVVENDNPCVVPEEAEPSNDTVRQASISMFDDTMDLDIPVATQDRYAHLPQLPIPDILRVPPARSPLSIFNRTTSFLLMETKSNKTPTSVTLHAKSSQGPLTLEIPINTVTEGKTIHHLAVCKLVQELEEGQGWIMDSMLDGKKISESSRSDEFAEREAVRLGLKYQVANRWCSFVAVEEGQASTRPSQADEVVIDGGNGLRDGNGGGRFAPVAHERRLTGRSEGSLFASLGTRPKIGGKACRRLVNDFSPDEEESDNEGSSPVDGGCKTSLPTQHGHKGLNADSSIVRPSASMALSASMPLFASHSAMMPRSNMLQRNMQGMPDMSMASVLYSAHTDKMISTPPLMPQSPLLSTTLQTQQTPASDIDKVRQLITMQKFAGYWEWDSAVIESYGIDMPNLLAKMSTHGLKQDNATMTALVLQFLTTKMVAHKGVWELVVEKGVAWFDKEMTEEQKMQLGELAKDVV